MRVTTPAEAQHRCQNCGVELIDEQLLEPIEDVFGRVEPGEPMPSGQCPLCGALCQRVAPETVRTPEDLAYIEKARAEYGREGEIEIDDNAVVSHAHNHPPDQPCHDADDHGAYVAAWVWVENEEEEAR